MAKQKRFCWTLRICAGLILLSGAGSVLAQQRGRERLLRGLTGESDAAFEQLTDRCILDHGRRICPGEDRDAGTTGDADIAPGPPPERAVTWVPGVRSELDEHLALEDRIRERLDLSDAAGAVEDAQRLLAMAESARGASLLTALELYGDALTNAGQYNDAETQYLRALRLKLPESDAGGIERLVGSGTDLLLGKLANIYAMRGQLAQALKLSARALRLAGDGKLDPNGAWVFYNHARIATRAGTTNEAKQYFRRGAELFLAFYGEGSRDAAYGFDALGRLARAENDWPEAVADFRRAAEIERRALNAGHSSQNAEPDTGGVYIFLDLVAAEYGLAAQQPERRGDLLDEAFEAAQWASQKTAAAALSQMAARQAKGAGPLAELLRHQQDLVTQWHQTSTQLAGALLASSSSDEAKGPKALRSRLSDEEREIRQTDERLAAEFPDYFALMKPAPLSVDQVRRLLSGDEALVLFTFTESDLFIWTVSRNGASWRRAALPAADVAKEVQALRCGLDASTWSGPVSPCSALLGRSSYTEDEAQAGRPLPFDIAKAHALYKILLEPDAALIQSKRLLIAPSGALTALPFHVLVTAAAEPAIPASADDYANAAWLARSHAITVLPSPSSLRALRELSPASRADRPYIAFGNPLVLGETGEDRSAWTRENCAAPSVPAAPRLASLALVIASYFRGGLANTDELRHAPPLPETADEVCAVANSLSALRDAVYLGARATEREVKALSVSGDLARARIVHFATHGLLAGETRAFGGKAEPALLLTPPTTPTEEDDGLLTASEAAMLRLDADWVILSACNTAAAERPGAEALSGLSRAFFYAGARSLLVSHWPVDSDAAAVLTTGAVNAMKAEPGIGRAEALRRAEAALIAKSGRFAHPSVWAPFVLVGNGEH